jgi:hypothetical protein
MSLLYYGVIILGAVLGGSVLLVIFSLLVMAKRSEEAIEQMELEMLKTHKYTPFRINSEKSENLRVPAIRDLYHGGTT